MFCLPDSYLELLSETPRVLLLLDYFQECLLALSLGALLRSDFTSYLCATHTGHRRASFHTVSQLTFPSTSVFFDAAIGIKCFGVSIRCGFFPCALSLRLQQDLKQANVIHFNPGLIAT